MEAPDASEGGGLVKALLVLNEGLALAVALTSLALDQHAAEEVQFRA